MIAAPETAGGMDEDALRATPIGFAEHVLGLSLYGWQDRALAPLERAKVGGERIKISLCTPNGAGKSERIVATAVLWWLALHARGKVVVTTKSGMQLDSQVEPALQAHRTKFPAWRFIQREITTPAVGDGAIGGRAVLFTTDEPGRAEGHHPSGADGPLLVIVDEAKSVPEEIFAALDRCNYQAILLVSSAGAMQGRFYESQFDDTLGFTRIRVGLRDCPHIPKEKIADIIATYGPDHPFTRSTLHGEFMEAEGEARFDQAGLKELDEQAKAGHHAAEIGVIEEQTGIAGRKMGMAWHPEPSTGWVWCSERPIPGCRYIAWCDPMTGAQSEGGKNRDTHAAGILRLPYKDDTTEHDMEVVAVLHHPDGCRWDNDVLCERFSRLIRFFGDPMVICEANNAGVEVLRLLLMDGRNLWKREKRDHKHPGKKLEVVGFQTHNTTKNLWIGALAMFIREHTLVCKYRPAVEQFRSFILTEDGTGEAQQGCKDDFVTGVGLGLYARESATVYRPRAVTMTQTDYSHLGGHYGGRAPVKPALHPMGGACS